MFSYFAKHSILENSTASNRELLIAIDHCASQNPRAATASCCCCRLLLRLHNTKQKEQGRRGVALWLGRLRLLLRLLLLAWVSLRLGRLRGGLRPGRLQGCLRLGHLWLLHRRVALASRQH